MFKCLQHTCSIYVHTYRDVVRELAADAHLDSVPRVGPEHRRGPRDLACVEHRGGRRRHAGLYSCMQREGKRVLPSVVHSDSIARSPLVLARLCDPSVRSMTQRRLSRPHARTCSQGATVNSTRSCPASEVSISSAPLLLLLLLLLLLPPGCCGLSAHAWPMAATKAAAARSLPTRMVLVNQNPGAHHHQQPWVCLCLTGAFDPSYRRCSSSAARSKALFNPRQAVALCVCWIDWNNSRGGEMS